jgi:hypothetical protein
VNNKKAIKIKMSNPILKRANDLNLLKNKYKWLINI